MDDGRGEGFCEDFEEVWWLWNSSTGLNSECRSKTRQPAVEAYAYPFCPIAHAFCPIAWQCSWDTKHVGDHGPGDVLKETGDGLNDDEEDDRHPIEHVVDSRTGKSPGYRFMDHVAMVRIGHSKNVLK